LDAKLVNATTGLPPETMSVGSNASSLPTAPSEPSARSTSVVVPLMMSRT
jgi:hypothetical protein